MDEIRKALADGKTVELLWVPFTSVDIPSLRGNQGHRSCDSLAELEALVAEHGIPTIAFFGTDIDHVYVNWR